MPEWPCKVEDDANWLRQAGGSCAGLAEKVGDMRARNPALVLDRTVEGLLREVCALLQAATVAVATDDDPEDGD